MVVKQGRDLRGFREAGVWLAGVNVRNDLVTVLARMLELQGADETATALHVAVATGQATPPLSVEDRQRILAVFHDPPLGLEELRGVLLGELAWHEPIAS